LIVQIYTGLTLTSKNIYFQYKNITNRKIIILL